MTSQKQIKLLKVFIVIGLILIMAGHFIISKEWLIHLGPLGFIIGASCIAIGLICSLPTKIYLTILLMKNEEH
ncbi:hypothetical protein [Pseudoalteromonas phenolica]|uniref:Uncharacterized protein n=1 Tax=Pseudoalteromonas phenolica TaxID=161398 RepID=A0A0S2JXI0_9GAMM|nr:hypothetical protein [Pseudoalteromonas phenolica]ALO40701.1 hypothetical protein PP2015_173 [Pseudoalteromonas phenolica]MBE0354783.1 hypothetical protein [Pseudoalteromonas phenolica O-BC30]RXE93497.1 hypothetical protein D9981_20525 [Pseudoalteromonas phenolica O-BC30]TMO54864.1 hypothetical protein CWC21_13175 [Pseudoalteromonas phenolica]